MAEQVPRPRVRHPRRRPRPDLPAPRERDRPVEGGRRRVRHYWLHNAWVTTSGEKMSKSLGNSLLVDEVVAAGPARRAALLPRQRALPLDDRVLRRVARGGRPGLPADRGLPASRAREVLRRSEDAGREPRRVPRRSTPRWTTTSRVPQALAVVHEHRPRGQRGARRRRRGRRSRRRSMPCIAMLDVLGLNPWAEPWSRSVGARQRAPDRRHRRPRAGRARPSGRRHGRARTSRRPTPSATGWTAWASGWRTPARGVRWSLD